MNDAPRTGLSESWGRPLDIPNPILHDLIMASVQQHGPKVAMVCKHQPADLIPAVRRLGIQNKRSTVPPYLCWTHAQLQHGADLLAVGLLKSGFQIGSTIAVILSGRAEFHMALRAAVKLKSPFTPIHPRSAHNESEIRHILRLAGAKAILVESAADAAQLEKAAPELMGEMQVKMVVGAGTDAVPSTYLSLQTIASTAAEDESFQQTSDFLDHMPRHIDDVVFIWFTSGTTSLPKAAPHTNKSLTCNIRSWGEALDLDDTRAWLQILPMNSIVGSSWTLAYLISGGSITHVNYNFDVPAIAQAISAGENTDVLAVPSMIDLLAFSPLLKEPSNKGIDRLLVGGSKILRSHVEKAFEVIKCRRFSPFFGMTEGTSVCMETLYRVPSSLQDPIYAGYVNPGAKVRICAPEQTEPVPRGTPGELVQGGLQKIECYLGNQGQDNFFTDNGETWYRCGDQAVMSEDGRIAIVGRYKDMIIRGGMNIASAAVEAVISECTAVDAQVIGIPNDAAGEVPIAVINIPEPIGDEAARIKRCILDRMGSSYALDRVLSLRELGLADWPRTSTGKVLKREVQKLVLAMDEQKHQSNGLSSSESAHIGSDLWQNEAQLQQRLLQCVQETGILVNSIDDNFHDVGMDSLLALRLWNAMIRHFELGKDIKLTPNTIYECGSVRRLAALLKETNLETRTNADPSRPDPVVDEMISLVNEYSRFRRHRPGPREFPGKYTILLTGVTGSLGAHVLLNVLQRPDVDMVYCPIRGQNPTQRLEASLRRWSVDYREYADKIKVVPHDPAEAGLGFDRATRDTLLNTLTTIIHAAWPVNFQLPLASFRPHLLYLSNLIQLSLDVQLHRPACIFFCSSVGVALTTRGTRRIGEEPIMDCRQALSSGYTQSKLVAEYIMQRAAEDVGAWASNFRIGQIVGDTKLGLWNENEAPPLMIRSALTLGCLPALDLDCSWIPLDTLASAIVEIVTMSQQQPPRLVYNMCSPRTFSWKNDLLPKLAAAGLKFKTVGVDEWIAKLKDYGASHSLDIVAATCPAIKLLDFWEHEYGGLGQSTSSLEFDTKNSQADSWSLRSAPDVIESGLVELMVNAWMRNWNGSAVQKHVLN